MKRLFVLNIFKFTVKFNALFCKTAPPRAHKNKGRMADGGGAPSKQLETTCIGFLGIVNPTACTTHAQFTAATMEEIETQLDEATLDACINIESAHYGGNGGGIIEEAKSEAADHDTIRNSADDNDNDNDKVPMSLSCIVAEEIEMTVDAEEPLTSIMLSLMPSKSISPSGLKEISPAPVPTPVPTPVPPPLALPLASPLASLVLSVPKSAPKSTPAPVNKCSPNKLNTSALTTETTESSILNDSTELETSMNTTNNMNTSIQSRMLISSDIFTDAFDQLTDIAVDFGFVAADNSTIFADEDDIMEKEAAGAEGIIPIEQEEPGRIFQSTGTNSLNDDSASPFDEEKALDISLPFDEMPSTRITKKKSEDLSAIARIRYRQHQQDEGLTTARTHPEPESAAKPYEDIQRERHEKWRKNRQQATREEEQTMQIDEECDRDDLQEIEIPQLSLTQIPKRDRMKESTSASAPISDDPDTIEDFRLLELDISILTKPIEDAWMQSQAVLMEAVLGQKSDGDQYDDSDYDDDSCFSEDSSHYSEDDDISSQGSTSRGRRSRRSGKIIGKGRGSVTYSDDESESDEDFECHGSPSKSGHGGHNRNFLDVSIST